MKLYTTILILVSFNCFSQNGNMNPSCQKVIDSLTNEEVYKIADVMPKVEGGMSEIFRQMAKTIKLPANFTY